MTDLALSTAGAAASAGFSSRLKQRTQALHAEAERSGVVRDILRGDVAPTAYALFLRNLLPAYRELEAGLERRRTAPGIGGLALPDVYRSPAIHADLTAMRGPDWADALAVLPEGRVYAERIARAAAGDGSRLIAHAYVRTLGDLNGGQVLKRLLGRALGLGAGALSFYEFPGIADIAAYRPAYRAALDRAAEFISEPDAAVEEAAEAFRLNIALSEAVARETRPA